MGIKTTLLMLLISLNLNAQWVSKKDIAPMILTAGAGYTTGWREIVINHPNQLFARYPNLPRRFWDNRVQSEPGLLNMEWNADHVLKGATVLCFTAAVTFKIGEKKKWYWYLVDGVKYFASYHLGFFLSYNVQHKNKL